MSPTAIRLDATQSRLAEERRVNLVTFAALRAAHPELTEAQFRLAIDELVPDLWALHTFDGCQGRLTDAERAASIVLGGRTFYAAARRERD